MIRPAYFVVQRINGGGEVPAIFWDELPRQPIRNLVYVQRLDLFPNGAALVNAPLSQLFEVYQFLKARGKLPPRWQPPPRKNYTGPAKLKPGHREYHARRFMPDAPYEETIVSPRGEAAGVGGPVQHSSASRSEAEAT
jgi:hypothetical protein